MPNYLRVLIPIYREDLTAVICQLLCDYMLVSARYLRRSWSPVYQTYVFTSIWKCYFRVRVRVLMLQIVAKVIYGVPISRSIGYYCFENTWVLL